MLSTLAVTGSAGLARQRKSRASALVAIVAPVLAAAYLWQLSPRPGSAIRGELLAAAGELSWQIVAEPTEPVRQAMRRHFREPEVAVDIARSGSNVLVTLRGLDQAACKLALREARRMEGTVVVALESHRSPADCGERNDMTWRLMP